MKQLRYCSLRYIEHPIECVDNLFAPIVLGGKTYFTFLFTWQFLHLSRTAVDITMKTLAEVAFVVVVVGVWKLHLKVEPVISCCLVFLSRKIL